MLSYVSLSLSLSVTVGVSLTHDISKLLQTGFGKRKAAFSKKTKFLMKSGSVRIKMSPLREYQDGLDGADPTRRTKPVPYNPSDTPYGMSSTLITAYKHIQKTDLQLTLIYKQEHHHFKALICI